MGIQSLGKSRSTPPWNTLLWAHDGEEGDLEHPAWITQGLSSSENLITFCGKMHEERVVPNFSKTFDTLSHNIHISKLECMVCMGGQLDL